MAGIRILTDDVASRIAAGEVVERPASVVKELVENSLDAGAGHIEVAVEAGGRALIRVTDDGRGMGREDLALCARRHATSKLRSVDDLDGLTTMGFRGEALPSIASVSLLSITSCTGEGEAGWCLEIRGGGEGTLKEKAAQPGTTVEVRSLFFNTPARRKFLRSVAREGAVIADVVTSLALAHPELAFRLRSDGRRSLDAATADGRAERVIALMQRGDSLIPVSTTRDGMEIEAWVSGAGESRTDRSAQRFFVNGRPVRDKALSHAVSQAYGPVLPPGRHPIVAVFLRVPPGEVDVNVHPTKSEVRFRRGGAVHAAVASVLRSALRGAGALPSIGTASSTSSGPARPFPTGLDPADMRARLFERRPDSGASLSEPPISAASAYAPGVAPTGGQIRPAGALSSAQAMAQYRNSYIVASDDEGLVLVDQHAAHERVLFEKLLAADRASRDETQPLLVPVTISLPPDLLEALVASVEPLSEIGFEVEPFGPDGAIVRAVPAGLTGIEPGRLLEDVLADLSRARDLPGAPAGEEDRVDRFPGAGAIERRRRAAAASAGCHAAIKVHMPLTLEKMNWVLTALENCRVPTTCPHGRPTTLRLSHGDIERAFHRA